MTSDITFSSATNGAEDIYVMNIAGTDVRRLTYASRPGVTNRTPEWSPDKSKIAFQSNRDGAKSLFLFDVATSEVRRLTTSNRPYNHPAWSSTGKTIACVSEKDGFNVLTLIAVDDSSESFISPKVAENRHVFNPCWVPGGKKLAFVLQGGGGERDALWTINLDGTEAEEIGPAALSLFEFDYSPDGSAIVFDAKVSAAPPLGDWDIFIMRADGSEVRRLTDLAAMSSRPKWLPDGASIVFHSNRFADRYEQPAVDATLVDWFSWWNQFEICTMNADGTNVRRLTANNLRDLHPDG